MTLERKTAATIAVLTVVPPTSEEPIAADSGMPSSSAPRTSAIAPPALAWVCWVGLLRRCPPRESMTQSPAKKTRAPATRPDTVAACPAPSKPSRVSSKATALMSTPAPKPMTNPMVRVEARA